MGVSSAYFSKEGCFDEISILDYLIGFYSDSLLFWGSKFSIVVSLLGIGYYSMTNYYDCYLIFIILLSSY